MAQTALEAFPLGYSQAPDCCPRSLVDHFHPHVGQRSALRAGTKPRLSGTPSVDPIPARRQSQDQLMVRSKADQRYLAASNVRIGSKAARSGRSANGQKEAFEVAQPNVCFGRKADFHPNACSGAQWTFPTALENRGTERHRERNLGQDIFNAAECLGSMAARGDRHRRSWRAVRGFHSPAMDALAGICRRTGRH